jgi:hypothetical protein
MGAKQYLVKVIKVWGGARLVSGAFRRLGEAQINISKSRTCAVVYIHIGHSRPLCGQFALRQLTRFEAREFPQRSINLVSLAWRVVATMMW